MQFVRRRTHIFGGLVQAVGHLFELRVGAAQFARLHAARQRFGLILQLALDVGECLDVFTRLRKLLVARQIVSGADDLLLALQQLRAVAALLSAAPAPAPSTRLRLLVLTIIRTHFHEVDVRLGRVIVGV